MTRTKGAKEPESPRGIPQPAINKTSNCLPSTNINFTSSKFTLEATQF